MEHDNQQLDEAQADRRSPGIGRRGVVVAGAVTTLAAAAGVFALRDSNAGPRAQAELGPLHAGASVGRWTVVAVHPERFGAVAIVLATQNGQRYQVDVLARDPSGPDGVANTERFSLFVSNQGDGAHPTDEEEGLGALALAGALSDYEASQADSLPTLLTFAERSRTYPNGSFGVPLA